MSSKMNLQDKVRNITKQIITKNYRVESTHLLRNFIADKREEIKKGHINGKKGSDTVRAYSKLVDKVIEGIYFASIENFDQKFSKKKKTKCVLIAIGGYGREELSPYSDVDILFLYEPLLDIFIDNLVKDIITTLWDTGFKVGHSCRTIKESMRISSLDLSAQTAMIESRYIIGNKELYKKFNKALKKNVIDKGIDFFINRKILERKRRHTMYDESVNLLEPNIKESPGGLRDFHITMWAAATKYGVKSLKDLFEKGLISKKEMKSIMKSYDFLLRVRNDLHFLVGKRWDILDINIQKRVAYNLGYRDKDNRKLVELFMQDYYINATNIYYFSTMFLDKCLAKKVLKYKKGKDIDGFFVTRDSQIDIKNGQDIFKKNPILLMKVFSYVQRFGLEISIETRKAIASYLYLIDEKYRELPEARDIFLMILKEKSAGRALRLMNELGVLDQYIPEFNPIKCLVQYDSYHKYTVDEHTLKSIEILEDLPKAKKKGLGELSELYKEISNPELIKLALLFHDIGKSGGPGHIKRGGVIADSIMERMGLPNDVSSKIRFLIDNHLVMSHISQRRDMHDHKVIREFAELIKEEENLKMLSVLTYADTKAVGHDIWSEWKATLLMELYNKAMDYIRKGGRAFLTGRSLINRLEEEILKKVPYRIDKKNIQDYLEMMPQKYTATTSAERIAKHIKLAQRLVKKKLVIDCCQNLDIGYTELMVCTHGKTGLFSMIAGTLTSKNINILGAQIFTKRDGVAIDTLQIKDLDGKPILDNKFWLAFEKDLLEVIEGKKSVEELISSRKRYVFPKKIKGPKVDTEVRIKNDISDTHTVIEVIAEDRIGLLYNITDTLFRLDLDIYIAKISTEANKAIDVFYVTDLKWKKIFYWKKLRGIEIELKRRLSKK